MAELAKYLKKTTSRVVAIQLALETDGFNYRKWGGTQTCKAGAYLVYNEADGKDGYAVEAEAFEKMYERAG